jgi:phosphatidylglycerophosphate synthase
MSSAPRRDDITALLDARSPAAWRVVGGIPLVTRLVRSLELAGVSSVAIATDGSRSPADVMPRERRTRIACTHLSPDAPLADALPERDHGSSVFAADATLVVDRRLVGALLDAKTPTVVFPVPADAAGPSRVRLARLDPSQLAIFGEPWQAASAAAPLDPASLDTWYEEMREPRAILLLDASTPDRAAAAGETLVLETQKGVMDAPARWIDPFFENAMLRALAPTRVTPNMVSVGGTSVGVVAAFFLWQGLVALAFPLMILVGWLDGVDGKLARLRLQYTTLGAGESYLDFFYENLWWFALTAHLRPAHGDAALVAGGALVLGNLCAEGMLTLGFKWLKTSLDLLTPFDNRFRLVAGRRNVYVWILVLATLAGSLWTGFVFCAVWAVVTGLEHAARLAMALAARRRSA